MRKHDSVFVLLLVRLDLVIEGSEVETGTVVFNSEEKPKSGSQENGRGPATTPSHSRHF